MLQGRRPITRWSMLVLAAFVGLGALPAQADPPVFPPTIRIPAVFCFRLTDIRRVPGDLEGNRFQFEFEVLNWSGTEAFDLRFAVNAGTGFGGFQNLRPFLAGAGVDANGRPLGAGDDDGIFPPADGTAGAKTGRTNTWTVVSQTASTVAWQEPTLTPGNGILPRDLLAQTSTAAACQLVPGCVVNAAGDPVVADVETVDNGGSSIQPGPDNVLDGFVIDVDDFDPGEMISINWFLTGAAGNPIGVSGAGNSFGFGVFNIFRVASDGPPIFQRIPGAPEGPGANIGTSTNPRDLFVATTPEGDLFQTELGAAVTGPFLDAADNALDAPVNGQLLVPPLDRLSGTYLTLITVRDDPNNAAPMVGMPGTMQFDVDVTQQTPGVPSFQIVATGQPPIPEPLAGAFPMPLIDSSFGAFGDGTVAGVPSVPVGLNGRLAPSGRLEAILNLGGPGQPLNVSYDVVGLKIPDSVVETELRINTADGFDTISLTDVADARTLLMSAAVAIRDTSAFGTLAPQLFPTAVDIYFLVLAPDGNTVVSFTDASFTPAFGTLSDLRTLRPIVAGVPVAGPAAVYARRFFSYQFTGAEPTGRYVFALLVTRRNALADNSVGPGEIVSLETLAVTVSP